VFSTVDTTGRHSR